MELKQELHMHAGHARDAARRWRKGLAPALWALLFVAVGYAAGFGSGFVAGLGEGFEAAGNMHAGMRVAELQAEARGDTDLAERLPRRAIDGAVRAAHHRATKLKWMGKRVDDLATALHFRVKPAKHHEMAKLWAGQRMASMPGPLRDTLAEYRRLGLDPANRHPDQSLADAYSWALGRTVTPAELVTDAELRDHLKSHPQFKAPQVEK